MTKPDEDDNMKLYRIELELKSCLATPLKGDTIWGHFVWGIANHEGDEAVAQFLDGCKSFQPPLICSSAFPHGFICKQMREPPERVEELSPDQYAEIKKLKKMKFEKASLYLDVSDVSANDEKIISTGAFKTETHTHNSISRTDGTVTEGSLYSVEEFWPKKDDKDIYAKFDMYVLSSYDKDKVLQLAQWAFENGYGADSSTGKGVIGDLDIQEVKLKCSSKKYMALAPFIVPDMNAISNLRADIFIRSGKIGGAFVSELSPWKKTVVLYDEGAVFESDKEIEYIGQLLTNVHSDSRICQSGFAPVIPVE